MLGWVRLRGARMLSSAERLANYGQTVDTLRARIPDLLQRPLPTTLIHPNVTLKLLPESHAIEAHGVSAYRVSTKIITNALTLFVLPPHSRIAILSAYVAKASDLSDQRFYVHWRTTEDPSALSDLPTASLTPGKILQSLNLSPREYPILAGSFEFHFSTDCDKVLVHIVRDVEYLTRPAVAFE